MVVCIVSPEDRWALWQATVWVRQGWHSKWGNLDCEWSRGLGRNVAEPCYLWSLLVCLFQFLVLSWSPPTYESPVSLTSFSLTAWVLPERKRPGPKTAQTSVCLPSPARVSGLCSESLYILPTGTKVQDLLWAVVSVHWGEAAGKGPGLQVWGRPCGQPPRLFPSVLVRPEKDF